jgi:hypothetical protein
VPEPKTNKAAYEARRSDGEIYGAIGPADWDRFRQTLAFVLPDARSLLDCGCDRGHWLDYVCRRRQLEDHMGVDVAAERIAEARSPSPLPDATDRMPRVRLTFSTKRPTIV